MKYIPIVLLSLLSSTLVQAEENKTELSGLNKLEQKMQAVNDYYQKVNEKLNGAKADSEKSNFIQPNTRRDPFSYTEEMYRNQPKSGSNTNSQNHLASNALMLAKTTAFTADGLPIMKYRGYAESASGEVIGILEVLGMGVYTVRIGDQIGLHNIVKELVLTIEGLNRNNIIIKTGKLGTQLVVQ